jgi:hypothetical protein
VTSAIEPVLAGADGEPSTAVVGQNVAVWPLEAFAVH